MSFNCYPAVMWLVAAYVSSVWSSGEGEICAAELFGFLKFEFKIAKMGSSTQVEQVNSFLI